MVTWDSDGSSNSDDSSDDGKKSLKKALASIAINNKPSIFDTWVYAPPHPTLGFALRLAQPLRVGSASLDTEAGGSALPDL